MANKVYDDQTPADEKLRRITGVGGAEKRQMEAAAREGAELDKQERVAAQADSHSVAGSGAISPTEVGAREKGARSGPGFYKSGDREAGMIADRMHDRKSLETKRQKASDWVQRHKKKLIGGGLAGGILGGGMFFFGFFQFGTLLIPTLTENIADNRYARITRNLTASTESIVRLKLALDSTNDQRYRAAIEAYRATSSKPSDVFFNKVNSLRPKKLTEQLLLDVDFVYSSYTIPGTNITRNKIVALQYKDGTTIPLPENQFNWLQKRMHPWQYWRTKIDGLQTRYSTLLNRSHQLNPQAGPTGKLFQRIAALRASKYLQETFDIKRVRWSTTDLEEAARTQRTRAEARFEQTAHSYDLTTAEGSRVRLTADGDAEAERGIAETQECVHDPSCQRQMRQNGSTVAPQTQSRLRTVFDVGVLESTVRTISTVNDLGFILCLINKTGLEASRPVMKGNSAMAMATWASMAAAGDQQVYTQSEEGDRRVDASLTGGYNDQINGEGGAVASNAFREASGQPYDTSNTLSPQASASGTFATNPLGGILPSQAISVVNSLDNVGFCAAVENPVAATTIAGLELGLYLVPGINALKASGSITIKGVSTLIARSFGQAFKQQFSRQAIRGLGAVSTAANVAQLTSLIFQARAYQQMGAMANGAAQGEDYINLAESGAELAAQTADGALHASRPVTAEEYGNLEDHDSSYRSIAAQNQSFTQRYFAMDNPRSLLRLMSVRAYASFNVNTLIDAGRSLVAKAADIFNPISLWSNLNTKLVQANNPNVISRDYGIVQRGWTEDEETAFLTNADYEALYNEIRLDESGKRDDLMDKYKKCFTDDMADLLADHDVQRDENGNVVEGGLCSPSNLGDSGPPNDGELAFKNEEAELVFRLRVSMRNNSMVDFLTGVQEASDE